VARLCGAIESQTPLLTGCRLLSPALALKAFELLPQKLLTVVDMVSLLPSTGGNLYRLQLAAQRDNFNLSTSISAMRISIHT